METGKTRMTEAETINAARAIKLLIALLAMYPRKRVIAPPTILQNYPLTCP